jgi:hypothetical protein
MGGDPTRATPESAESRSRAPARIAHRIINLGIVSLVIGCIGGACSCSASWR